MFWRFGGYANISAVNTILDKQDFTLEELLDESDLIQELKQHNSKLIEYLRTEAVLDKLLEYVVASKLAPVAPPSPTSDRDDEAGNPPSFPESSPTDETEKKRNRYAFVAAEVLSSDNWSIYDAVMESQHLLRRFWKFLALPAPLDPLQASYFSKVNESLFDKKTDDMLILVKSIDGAVTDMLRHVDCPMIMDLLLKIITLERAENGQGTVEWLYSQDLMPTLLSFLGPEYNWATQTSAGDFLKAIITVSANASQNEQTCIGPNELTRQLVSKPCVEKLIKSMLRGGNPLTVGVGIVIEVIRKNNSDYDPDVGAEPNSTPSSRDPIYLGTLLRMFADHVPDFVRLIMNAPAQKQRLDSTFGTKIEPLGFDRFKTCELMAELLHCSNMGLLNAVGSEDLISVRDAERQKLRSEGKLAPARTDEANTSADDLTMRAPHTEERRLEVTNVSDDDGFEKVAHSGEMNEDTSHEFVKAEDEILKLEGKIPKPDDNFVDEPLASPKPKHATLDRFIDDVDMVVPPLSPTKKAAPSLPLSPKEEQDTVDASTDKVERLSLEEKEDEPEAMDVDKKVETPAKEPESPVILTSTSSLSDSQPEQLDAAATASESEQTSSEPTAKPDVDAKSSAPESPVATGAEQEAGEASIIVAHRPEERPHTPNAPLNPVVGDYLKMQFVEYKVVPTILSFFFTYPWNNFLHNVVYDVVQQVFNGPMDRGFNPTLAISLFESADVTAQIIRGQWTSEQSQANSKTRMGYMGHLTLIAEEVVKFTERHPPELLSDVVMEKVLSQAWINYVEGPLAETRERDNAILGGVRPEVAVNKNFSGGLGAVGVSGLAGGLNLNSGQGSNALAEAGLNGGSLEQEGGNNGIGPFAISAGTLMSGFGSSSDEDEDDNEDNDEDINNEFRAYTDPLNNQPGSLNPPSIPPPPPPPPPLNIPPSRARLQLAARLAMHNQKGAVPAAAGTAVGGVASAGSAAPANSADTTSSNGEEPELVHCVERPPVRPRNPFASDEDGDDDGIDSDDDDDDPAAPPPGSSLRSWGSRGSWWREVMNRGAKGPPGARLGEEGDDGDSIGDEEDETGSATAEDDEEFGEFAMPELSTTPKGDEAKAGPSKKEEEGSEDGDKEPERVIVKPLPVHPPVTGKSGFGSLWPFGGEKEGGEAAEEKEAPEGGIKKTVEAMKRTTIEDPDEDEVVVPRPA